MKQIQLTQGYVARVSDKDYPRVNQYKWCAQVLRRKDASIWNVYAVRSVRSACAKRHVQLMHRFILEVEDSKVQVDHRDGNGLNNTRGNLRPSTRAENMQNQRLSIANRSGVKGVYWHRTAQKWQATIRVDRKNKHLGLFTSLEDAKRAYDVAALKYFKAFALTNNMMEQLAA